MACVFISVKSVSKLQRKLLNTFVSYLFCFSHCILFISNTFQANQRSRNLRISKQFCHTQKYPLYAKKILFRLMSKYYRIKFYIVHLCVSGNILMQSVAQCGRPNVVRHRFPSTFAGRRACLISFTGLVGYSVKGNAL